MRKMKLFFRLCVFILAVLCGIQLFPSEYALALPAMSPFLAICSAISMRYAGLLFLACVPILVLSFVRTRWFCSYMCPVGLTLEYAGKMRPSVKSRYTSWPRLGQWLLLLGLGGALAGYPFFIWLDPLSLFNGFMSVWHKPVTLIGVLPAVGLTLILLLNIWRPNTWCYRFCPLGALQEYVARLKRAADKKTSQPFSEGRRVFLGLLAGSAAGLFARRRITGGIGNVIRPPGAVREGRFTALCARCGNCIRACKEKIIYPDLGTTGLAGLLTPVLKMGPGYCSEWCNECNKVCPTGAISHVNLNEKRTIRIGTARVYKEKCLAWRDSAYCVVCHEYCAYQAIKLISNNGVNCPEVDPEVCRGCGLCQTVCPAESVAIIVEGCIQKRLPPVNI